MNNRIIMILGIALLASSTLASNRIWDGGGTEANWDLADNWDGTIPVAGDALFFGGSAKVTNTNNLADGTAFSGMTFNSEAGAFSLWGNAVTLEGNISNLSSNTQTVKLPLSLSGLSTFYSPGANFTVNGTISGSGGLIADVTNRTFTLTASNTYEGVTYVTNGTLAMTHSCALGSTNAPTMVYGRQNGRLQLGGGLDIYEPLTLNGQRPNYGQTLTCSGGRNTIWGMISKINEIRVGCGSGITLVFAGGFQSLTSGGDVILNPGGGTILFRDHSVHLGTGSIYLDQSGLIALAVAGNTWGDTRAAGSGGKIRADVTNVLPAATRLVIGAGHSPSGNFDLNGYDQTVGQLATDTVNAGTRVIMSVKPAVLTLNQSATTLYNGLISGAVHIIKNGTGTITFTNGISTTTGDFTVNTGTVVVAQSASLGTNANTIVNGGILELRTETALWNGTSLFIANAGKVKIASGVSATVQKLYINGLQQERGTYGTATSGASHIDDSHFADSGVLHVLYDKPGTMISVK